jgi:N-acetylglucosamine-6-sulfatase
MRIWLKIRPQRGDRGSLIGMSGRLLRPARTLVVLAATLILSSGLSACTGSGVRSSRPSIVLILTDDQRWDTLDGMPNVRQELAAHGVTFANGFVSDPLCCPSRASILTGQYAHSTGVWQNKGANGGFDAFHQDHSTIATWLQAAGYQTALFGKYLNRYEGKYVPPGWDRWEAIAGATDPYDLYDNYTLNVDGRLEKHGSRARDYSTDVLADDAVDFIRKTPGSLFLYFAPYGPHKPTRPSPKDRGRAPDLGRYRPPSFNESDVSDKPQWVRDLEPLPSAEQAKIDELRSQTYTTLLSVDRAVGRIVGALEQTGRLHNTLIVFMSDNGFLWGEHRFFNKAVPYEEAIRVPFVVRYDRLVQRPRVDPHLVVNIDLAPTFAAFAGVPAPSAEGMSFLPLLSDPGASWRTDFLVEHANLLRVPSLCGVRSERFMYVHYATGEEELYDLREDPYELENAAGDPRFRTDLAALRIREKGLCNPPPPVSSGGASDDSGE